MAACVSVYPFEPKTMIEWVMIVVLLYIIGVVAFVFAAVHRDSTLSYMTNTTAGELGAAFWVRMASFVIQPIVSLVVAQFPELSNVVFSWIQPGLQSLNSDNRGTRPFAIPEEPKLGLSQHFTLAKIVYDHVHGLLVSDHAGFLS